MKLMLKIRIKKLEKSFIRDRWGNLTNIYWNDMIKEDILKLEDQIKSL
jgi:hypothetical protein